jgi:hypothetical protein
MAKAREDAAQISDDGDPGEALESQADTDSQPDDNEPDVEISQAEDGGTVVRPGKYQSKREAREAARAEQLRKQVEGHVTAGLQPHLTRIEQLQKSLDSVLSTLASGGAQQQRQAPQQPAQESPYRRAVREQELLVMEMDRETRPDAIRRLRERWHEIEEEKQRELVERTVRPHLEKVTQQIQPSEPYELSQLRREFQDILQAQPNTPGDRARKYASSLYLQAQLEAEDSGVAFNPAVAHRNALTKAAVRYGLRRQQSSAPPANQAARFGGMAPGVGRGAGKEFRLTPEQEEMAYAWAEGDDIPEEEVVPRFIKQVMMKKD